MFFVVQADADDDWRGLKGTKDLFGTIFVSVSVCLGFDWLYCRRSIAYLAYGLLLVKFLEAAVWCSFKNIHGEALEARSELLLGHLSVVLLASRVCKTNERFNSHVVACDLAMSWTALFSVDVLFLLDFLSKVTYLHLC